MSNLSKIVAEEILDLKKINEALKIVDETLDSQAFAIYVEKHQAELDEAYENETQNANEANEQSEGFEMFALRRFVTNSLELISDMNQAIKDGKTSDPETANKIRKHA